MLTVEESKISSHQFFNHFRPEQLNKLIESSESIEFKAGEQICKKGDKATHLFIVLKGQVTLRIPGKGNISVLIDELGEGSLFGSCICMGVEQYSLNAYATDDSELLKIDAQILKRILDDDLVMGYTVQSMISRTYFKRYINTMEKLQAIVMNIPIQSDE